MKIRDDHGWMVYFDCEPDKPRVYSKHGYISEFIERIKELEAENKELEEDNADICTAYNAVREENERYKELIKQIHDTLEYGDVYQWDDGQHFWNTMRKIAEQAISTTKEYRGVQGEEYD